LKSSIVLRARPLTRILSCGESVEFGRGQGDEARQW